MNEFVLKVLVSKLCIAGNHIIIWLISPLFISFHNLANMRMTKLMGDTSQILTQINGIMNVKEMQTTMKDIQKSMMKVNKE